MDVFRKCLYVFDIFHVCIVRSCVCQLSLNEYMMTMTMKKKHHCHHQLIQQCCGFKKVSRVKSRIYLTGKVLQISDRMLKVSIMS